MRIKEITGRFGNSVPDLEIPVHPRTPEIQESVAEPEVFIRQLLIELKGKNLGLVDNRESGRSNFDFACGKFAVDRTIAVDLRSRFNPTGNFHDIFRS
tara:strand:- start:2447 stop:2740 length:294 start_codon:yes stop_codon:yes gene_type:complete